MLSPVGEKAEALKQLLFPEPKQGFAKNYLIEGSGRDQVVGFAAGAGAAAAPPSLGVER